MSSNEVFVVSAKRTPIGSLLGQFSTVPTVELGATAIRAALDAINLDPNKVDEVYMGNVLTAGEGQAPARQAAMAAGIPLEAGATTVNKVCGSGLKAIMIGRDGIIAGSSDVVVAGGMENMTLAPHLSHIRGGVPLGDTNFVDHLMRDGLNHPDGRVLGTFSQTTADEYGFTREQQDEYARATVLRSRAALEAAKLKDELVPVEVVDHKGERRLIDTDEMPLTIDLDKLSSLKPAFSSDGSITAATASRFCDGAAAVVLMSGDAVERLGVTPLARVGTRWSGLGSRRLRGWWRTLRSLRLQRNSPLPR